MAACEAMVEENIACGGRAKFELFFEKEDYKGSLKLCGKCFPKVALSMLHRGYTLRMKRLEVKRR